MRIKDLTARMGKTYLLPVVMLLITTAGGAAVPSVRAQQASDDQAFLEADSLYAVANTHYWEGRYAEAEPLYARLLALRERLLGPEHNAVAETLTDLGLVYHYQGRYAEAEPYFQRALAVRERALGPDHPDLVVILQALGLVYLNQGRLAEATTPFERAHVLQQQAFGPDYPGAAGSSGNLAGLYYLRGHYARADSLYRHTLAMQEQALPPGHPDLAATRNGLAQALDAQGRYAEAERLYRNALAIWTQTPETDTLTVAWGYDNLAANAYQQGRYAEADSLYRRALTMRRQRLGPDHPHVAATLHDMALLYTDQGRYAEADSLYRRVLEIRVETLGIEHLEVAKALNGVALLRHALGAYDKAEQLFEEARTIQAQAAGSDHPDAARTLNNLATLYVDQGRYDEAEPLYRQALTIQEAALGPDHPDVATTLNNLALLYHGLGRYREVEPAYRRALAIAERIYGVDHPEYAVTLNNLGLFLVERGRYEDAEPMLERARDITMQRLGPQHEKVGVSLINLAALYEDQGRFVEAEPLYQQALDLTRRALGADHVRVADILDNLARLYNTQGRYPEAEHRYQQALDLRRRTLGRDHPGTAESINGLAVVYQYQERYDEAEPLLREALALQEKGAGRETLDYVTGLNNLAILYAAQERYDEATTLFEEALTRYAEALGADHPAITHALLGLAETRLDAGQRSAARAAVDQALDVFNATPGYYPTWHAKAYTLRARIHQQNGRRDAAIRDLEQALRLVERIRPKIGGGEQTRAAFFTPYTHYYDDLVAWHLDAGHLERAFEYAERGRARVLLDQLAAGQVSLLDGVAPERRAALEAREAQAGARLAEFQQRLTLLRARSDLSEDEHRRHRQALEDSLAQADQAYRQVDHDIKNASLLWRSYVTAGGQPQDLTLVQDLLVPPQGLMLLYQIGHEASHVFVIPPYGGPMEVLRLQVTEEHAAVLAIEAGALTSEAVRRSLGLLAVESEERPGLFRQMTTRGTKAVRGAGQAAPEERLHALWQVLVPPSVWPRLVDAAEVVLIPDEALHYLPFEALVVEPGDAEQAPRYWLDAGPVLRYAPSATALYNIMNRPASGARPAAGEATILSLSAPLFDPQAVAAAEARAADSSASALPARDDEERLGGSFAALPGTARETDAILAAVGDDAGYAVEILQGVDATEANLRRVLPGKRYLHLATHGVVDEGRGALFASLVLTPPARETAALADDGFLQLHEIYTLPLPEAELAVLSACKTNVGPTVAGEGVFALSRGFLAAGARRVVASQWAVDDASTAALMGAFFDTIVTAQRAGRRIDYAHALRDAKRLVRSQEPWSDPYHWAPFLLTGQQ